MRAAQKIAYGHAGTDHIADFPKMTRDQLADLIYGKMKRSIENPQGLRLGQSSSDGAPVIYDPKDNVMIVRDSGAADAGTVFKPNLEEKPDYVHNKFGSGVESFEPGKLNDGPLPAPAEPPVGLPQQAELRPSEPPVNHSPVKPAAPCPEPPRPGRFGGGSMGGGGGGMIPVPGHGPAAEPME